MKGDGGSCTDSGSTVCPEERCCNEAGHFA